MAVGVVPTDYVDRAFAGAEYDKPDDGTFAGRVPDRPGTVAFGATLRGCEEELLSALGNWILLGLRLEQPLPIIGGIDLNQEPRREPVDAL